MTEEAKKTWALSGTGMPQETVTGTHVEVNSTNGRVNFYDGEELVGSFMALHGFLLLTDEPEPAPEA